MSVRPPNPVTILVVDDDEGHCELIRRNLRRAAPQTPVVVVHSGEAALDYVHGRGLHAGRAAAWPLLILLDINMPGAINGLDVLRQLKTDASTRNLPVIMLTTTDDPREIARCYELGCNIYVTKPVDPTIFIDAIHRLGLFIEITTLAPLVSEASP
jgi:CheY-like chemotaxis protein